ANNRVERGKTPTRRIVRNHPHVGDGVSRRAGHSNSSVPSLQYSVGVDGSDAAGWRLLVRFDLRLRLYALCAATLAAGVLRAHFRVATQARRCRGVPPPLG